MLQNVFLSALNEEIEKILEDKIGVNEDLKVFMDAANDEIFTALVEVSFNNALIKANLKLEREKGASFPFGRISSAEVDDIIMRETYNFTNQISAKNQTSSHQAIIPAINEVNDIYCLIMGSKYSLANILLDERVVAVESIREGLITAADLQKIEQLENNHSDDPDAEPVTP